MATDLSSVHFELDTPVGNDWANVELLRTSILNCLAVVFSNSDFCHAVSMVGGELLENAVKYGDWSRPNNKGFRLRVSGLGNEVSLEVANPVVPNSPGVRKLLETVEWMRTVGSPQEAYMAKLREAGEAAERGEQSGSYLGLVRIAYEGGCKIDATVSRDHVLSVRATCHA